MVKEINSNTNIDKILIENFVSLQKVLTDLVIKLDNLSNNIEKLLELFETSAKSIAENKDLGNDKETSRKIDTLLEQNKTIAKGLSLMNERDMLRKRNY